MLMGILNKMRLLFALTLLATDLCVTNEKNIHSVLAPTNCKLVFNSTPFEMGLRERARVKMDEGNKASVSKLKPNH